MGEFKDVLRDLRISKGLTQGELAEKTNMSTSSVSMYEKGNRKPSMEVLETFADFFNVDMNYLTGKEIRSTYYLDPETAALAQELHDNPQYRALLDSSKKLSPEALKEVMNFIDFQTKKECGSDD